MVNWVLPFLWGLGAGILSAWGVGGGTLLLLVMTLFLDVEQSAAQGINLLFFLPTAAAALVRHKKEGFLDKSTLRWAIPPALLLAAAAAWAAAALGSEALRRPFGIYLLLSAAVLLWPSKKRSQ